MMLFPQPHPQRKDTQWPRLVAFGIVAWNKLYCFEEDFWWNTFQNPPSIQRCSKLNMGGLLEDSNVEHSFEILSTAKKKKMLPFFALADEETIYHRDGQNNFFFLLSICISKSLIKRPSSPPVVLFDEVPS